MQLAVEHVEAEEAHLRLGDRRFPRLRWNAVTRDDSAVARRQTWRAAQPLLLRAAATSGHVPPPPRCITTAVEHRHGVPARCTAFHFAAAYSTSTSSPTRAGSRPRSARCRAGGGVNSCFITRHLYSVRVIAPLIISAALRCALGNARWYR